MVQGVGEKVGRVDRVGYAFMDSNPVGDAFFSFGSRKNPNQARVVPGLV